MSEHKKFEFTTPMAVVAAGLFIAGAILYSNAHPAPSAVAVNTAGAQNLPANVNVSAPSAQDHIIGDPNAPIVLIEYSDFQCPFCSMVYPTIKNIVDQSGGKIAWVMRNFPLTSIHPQANPAANAAECIAAQLGNKGWWEYSDAVFNNQDKLNPAYSRQLAQQFGANMSEYDACVSSSKYQQKIDAEESEGQNNGGQGTPYTVVYSKGKQIPIAGAVPVGQFQSVINSL
jgi:protein-disulfide isomerase